MRIKPPRLPVADLNDALAPAPRQWPVDKAGVIAIARDWYAPDRVKINLDAIDRLPANTIPAPTGTNFELPIQGYALEESVGYCIAVNAINHMFWKVENGQFIRYEHHGQVGALGMTSAFQAAWLDGNSPIRRAVDHKVPLTAADITAIFGDIPDVEGRVTLLNEVLTHPQFWALSEELSERMNTVDVANDVELPSVGTEDAARLANYFPTAYGDEVLKKAQLAISAVWRAGMAKAQEWNDASIGCELTAFADYQIPNVLRALGMLEYAPDLAERIDQQQLIEAGSVDERALRAAAILAVEKLATAQNRHVADVDYWLWLNRKQPKTPFHLTITTDY